MEQGEAAAGGSTAPDKEKSRRRRNKKHSKRPSKAKRARAKKRKRPASSSSSGTSSDSTSSSSSDSEDDSARDLRKLRKQVAALARSQSSVQETLNELSANYGGLRTELVAVKSRLDDHEGVVDMTVNSAVHSAVSAAETRQAAARTALSERLTTELQAAIADFQATLSARSASQPPATPASLRIALSESPSVQSASPTSRHSR
jgi:chromosome segregation ATPase